MVFWMSDRLDRTMQDEFPFLNESGHIISIVGAGGKTSLLYYLAQEYCKNGYRTAVVTTTKIFKPIRYCETMEQCRKQWKKKTYAVCGREYSEEKLMFPDEDFWKQIYSESEAIIIESDGAAGKPCKIPAEHEPVIRPESDIVIAVLGMDAFGETIENVCFRPQHVADFLNCKLDHTLLEEDLMAILTSECGSRKSAGTRDYYIVLNKCENNLRRETAQRIKEELRCQGYNKVFLTCFK